ncbi:MAG: high-affinity nickel-transport family protein [Candidatus Acidiferrales bacterium]
MTSGLAILAIGFFLGMRHATDPDHVIAVSTIVSREQSIGKAGLIGMLWGVGHTVTILAVGMGIILFGLAIPSRLGLTMEFSVGVTLILLGVLNLSGAMKCVTEKFAPAHPPHLGQHVHGHGAHVHFHRHTHGPGEEHHSATLLAPRWLRVSFAKLGLYQSLRPLLIGIVHGLAGSAAVALLVLGAIHEPRWAVFYLLVFGVGTIAGMMLITAAIALPFSFASYKMVWLHRGLVTGSGLLSLVFGLFVSYHIGFVDGLFSNHPSWTSH